MNDDFTKVKDMCMPRNLILGHGVISKIADVCDDLIFGKDVMIITGNDTYSAAGRYVEDVLTGESYNVSVLRTNNATASNVSEAAGSARECNAKVIISVGGGSKIDIGKMVAKQVGIPMISIPTSASHDGIASGRASLKSSEGSQSVEAVVPLAVIADTEIIVRSPHRLLVSGCADVVSNMTAIKDWEFAKRLRDEEFSSYAYALSKYSAESLIENACAIRPNLEDSVWIAIKSLVISGLSMSVAGNSRPTSGSEHMFSHALDTICPGKALHGEQCGVGTIIMMYLHGGDWNMIRNSLLEIGAPTNADDLGIDREDIIHALTIAHTMRTDRFTILGDHGLSRDAAISAAKHTKVI